MTGVQTCALPIYLFDLDSREGIYGKFVQSFYAIRLEVEELVNSHYARVLF